MSEPLARSVDSLDGLAHLELTGLHEVLTLQDCYLHLGALGALRSLALDLQVPGVQQQGVQNAGHVASSADMLVGMPQLRSVSLHCSFCSQHVAHTSSDGAPCLFTGCPRCRDL